MEPVDAARLQNFESIVPVGALNVTGVPVEPYDVANKEYVDEAVASVKLTPGAGIAINPTTNVITTGAVQTNVTQVGTLTGLAVSGTSSLQEVSLNGNRLTNVALPILPTDGASKAYADSNLVAGIGIVKNGTTIETDTNQSHVTSIGTLASLDVTGAVTVRTPMAAGEAANKSYVDNALTMGTGLSKTGMTISVAASQPQITTIGTLTGLTVAGPAFLQGGADLQGWSIINLSDPVDPTDAANKSYVDNHFVGSQGISISNGVITLNAAQPNITSLGTLTSLDVTGKITTNATATNPIDVPNKQYVDGIYMAGSGLTKTGTTFAVGNTLSITTLTVSGATTVRNPQSAMEAATKSYVDAHYTAGPGLTVNAAGVFSVASTISPLDSLTVNGSCTLASGADCNMSSIINVGDPMDPQDVCTKNYCDTRYVGGQGITITNGTVALASTGTIANLTVTGKATVPTPTTGTDAANRAYVDQSFRAGSGLNLSSGTFSVTPNQPNITTLGTLTSLNVAGAATFQSGADANGSAIINVGDPVDPGDACPKSYVDTSFQAGTGLTLTNQRFSVNNTLPNVTGVGTLTGLTVTGASSFPVPPTASSACTRAYCEGYYSAGSGLNLTSGQFSILAAQPTITSLGTLTSLTVSGRLTVSSTPTVSTDCVNKLYCDSNFSAGTGLTKTGTMFSVNASQTQITDVGALNSITVVGSAQFQSGADFNGASVINLGDPFDDYDAAPKTYVDQTKGDLVNLTATGVIATPFQIAAATAGGNVTIGAVPGLIITGSGTVATLTITFPTNPPDGQRLVISSLVNVTSLTIANATMRPAAPTGLTSGQPLRFLYSTSVGGWVPI